MSCKGSLLQTRISMTRFFLFLTHNETQSTPQVPNNKKKQFFLYAFFCNYLHCYELINENK